MICATIMHQLSALQDISADEKNAATYINTIVMVELIECATRGENYATFVDIPAEIQDKVCSLLRDNGYKVDVGRYIISVSW